MRENWLGKPKEKLEMGDSVVVRYTVGSLGGVSGSNSSSALWLSTWTEYRI